MFKPTHDADAASILFNRPGYRVLSAGHHDPDDETAGRWVLVEAVADEGGCPDCGVMSERIHSRPVQVVKDVPCGGERLVVRVRKRRFACAEAACVRRTFVEETSELPFRARFTTRLAETTLAALRAEPRSVHALTVESGLSWPTVMGLLTGTVDPNNASSSAWGSTRHIDDFHREWAALEKAVRASKLPEAERLLKTLHSWRRELLTFCRTRITNARTEAANLNAKTFKRAGRGYRNHDNYRSRIMAYTPTPMAA